MSPRRVMPIADATHDPLDANPIRRLAADVLLGGFKELADAKKRPKALAFFESSLAQWWAKAAGMERDLDAAVAGVLKRIEWGHQPVPLQVAKYFKPRPSFAPGQYRCPCGVHHNYTTTDGLCLACWQQPERGALAPDVDGAGRDQGDGWGA